MINNSSKNLIYYTVSGDKNYLHLLNISIESLTTFGKYKGDILLICDRFIKDNISIDYPNLKFMIVDEVDKNLSSGNKLRIYEYENLLNYDNILFLDSDILIINDINLLFNESNLIKDKFIVSSEIGFLWQNFANEHAGELLTEDQKLIYKDIPSINAGCFLFRNNKENIEILKEIYEMYFNSERLSMYEQPYFNYVLLIKNKFIHNLQPYISHLSLIDKEKIIIHYCGGCGEFQPKLKFMKRDLEILKMDNNNSISYDIDILNIWLDDNKVFIKSKIDIEDSKLIIYYNDIFVYKELVEFSKNLTYWFKPGRDLEDSFICKVKVFDKYDNLINSIDLINNYNFKTSYKKDEDIIYISCDRNLQADVFILRTDNSTIYKTESTFTSNPFWYIWYKTDINLSNLHNIKIQIKKNDILLFEEVLSTNNKNEIDKINYIQTREELLDIVPKNSIGVEVGVFKGDFSKIILKKIQPFLFYMIDPWSGQINSGDKNGNNIEFINGEQYYFDKIIPEFLFIPNTKILRDYSSIIANFPDNYLDWIYIDGNHDYDNVKNDLKYSFPKIKNGGYIMGHDYTSLFPGVIQAVNEFCLEYNLHIEYLTQDGCPSYLIKKSTLSH